MLCTHNKYSKYTFTKKEKCSIPVLEGECSCPAPGELFLLCHMVVILLYSQRKYLGLVQGDILLFFPQRENFCSPEWGVFLLCHKGSTVAPCCIPVLSQGEVYLLYNRGGIWALPKVFFFPALTNSFQSI